MASGKRFGRNTDDSTIETEFSKLLRECSGDPMAQYRLESRHELLSSEKVVELFSRFRSGDQRAREEIILHNLRLVVFEARKFVYSGAVLPDLIQEGNIGLLRAVEKFDPARGNQFSTYATWWIRNGLFRAVIDSQSIRIPENVRLLMRRFRKSERALLSEYGRTPTENEVSEHAGFTENEFADARSALGRIVSLDEPMNDDSESTRQDFLVDPQDSDHCSLEQERFAKLICRIFEVLSDIEREIVERAYGLNGYDMQDVREIASAMALSAGGVDQKLRKALRKMKNLSRGIVGEVCL